MCAIREVTGPAGAILLVYNYTGDRLNFGIALEQAKGEGYKIEMCLVGEDCSAKPASAKVGRRGLAGTLFISKIGGAMVEEGRNLEDILETMNKCADSIGTMGCSLSSCTLPGTVKDNERIPNGMMEVGLGVHGEPGLRQEPIKPAD